MSSDQNIAPIVVDDAQLRYQSLMEHVNLIGGEMEGFPGAAGLKNLSAHYSNMATTLFQRFNQALEVEEDPKKKFVAKHKMVDKLALEWEIIFQLTANAKLLGAYLLTASQNRQGSYQKTTNNFSWLDVLVKTAQRDLGLDEWNFIVVPRLTQRYALTQFRYATEFAALDIPISSLNTPWEWGVLWHELAGRKIIELKSKDPRLFDIPSIIAKEKAMVEDVSKLIDQMMGKLQKDEAVGSPLLSRIRRLFQTSPRPDWSQDWVKEIFEDACSVLTFGEDFIPVLNSILNRTHTPSDKRHPNPEIRIRVARQILNPTSTGGNNEQEKIEQDVALYIRKLAETKLRLPILVPEQETDIHRRLQTIMKNFTGLTAPSAETESLKGWLDERVSAESENTGKPYRDSFEDVEKWEEVASGDYRKMLGMSLSESDLLGLTDAEHTIDTFGFMTIKVHDTIHEFYHGAWNHK